MNKALASIQEEYREHYREAILALLMGPDTFDIMGIINIVNPTPISSTHLIAAGYVEGMVAEASYYETMYKVTQKGKDLLL